MWWQVYRLGYQINYVITPTCDCIHCCMLAEADCLNIKFMFQIYLPFTFRNAVTDEPGWLLYTVQWYSPSYCPGTNSQLWYVPLMRSLTTEYLLHSSETGSPFLVQLTWMMGPPVELHVSVNVSTSLKTSVSKWKCIPTGNSKWPQRKLAAREIWFCYQSIKSEYRGTSWPTVSNFSKSFKLYPFYLQYILYTSYTL